MEVNGRPGAWFVCSSTLRTAYPAAILIATLRGADYMNFDMGKIYMMITVAIVPIISSTCCCPSDIIAGITLGGVKE